MNDVKELERPAARHDEPQDKPSSPKKPPRRGKGVAIRVSVEAPTLVTARHGEVPLVDAVATKDGDAAALFVVNRSVSEPTELSIDVSSLGVTTLDEALGLFDGASGQKVSESTVDLPEPGQWKQLDRILRTV